MLVNPNFLFRVERDPPGIVSQTAYKISDFELASRLSFFLWSSIPDDELLDVADRGELSRPDILEQQVRRMLADERAASLSTNFAGQWLYLRNLDSITPDLRLFPDFDDNLRQAMRQETELFFDSIRREDRSVLDFVQADYTFLNERLAKHYRIPHIYGSEFRRVELVARYASRRTVAAGQHPHGHVVRHANVARDSRQLGAQESGRPRAAATAAQCAGAGRQHGVGRAADPRAAGPAPCRSLVRRLPRHDGSGGVRAGELRRSRPLARFGRRTPGRCRRRPARRQRVHRRGRPGKGTAEASGGVCWYIGGAAADVRTGSGRGIVRRARGPADRPPGGSRRLSLLVDHPWDRPKHSLQMRASP